MFVVFCCCFSVCLFSFDDLLGVLLQEVVQQPLAFGVGRSTTHYSLCRIPS